MLLKEQGRKTCICNISKYYENIEKKFTCYFTDKEFIVALKIKIIRIS